MPPMSDEELESIKEQLRFSSNILQLRLLEEVVRLREIEKAAVNLCESPSERDESQHRKDWSQIMRLTTEGRSRTRKPFVFGLTKDGVQMTDGMTIYYLNGFGDLRSMVIPESKISLHLPEICFSTRAAAEASKPNG